jgi:uncharacterized membrane protein
MILLVPVYSLFETRIGYAWSLGFVWTVSGLAIYYLTKFYIKKIWPRFVFILIYFLSIYNYRLILSYHFEILFPALFFLLYIFRIHNRKTFEFISLLLISSIKEDISLYLFLFYLGEGIFGVSNSVGSRPTDSFGKSRSLDLFFGGFSAFLFFIGIPWIREMGDWEADSNWYLYWGYLGSDPRTMIQTALTDPGLWMGKLLEKSHLIWEISLGFGLLFWFHPRGLVPILGIFLLQLSSQHGWHGNFSQYYIYSILPFLWIGSLHGLSKILNFFSGPSPRRLEGMNWLEQIVRITPRLTLVLFIMSTVFYRNSLDKDFPMNQNFSIRSAESEISISEKKESANLVPTILAEIPEGDRIACAFDLGSWVPVKNPIMPLRKDFQLGTYPEESSNFPNPDWILVHSKTSFSPYLSDAILRKWKENWIRSGSFQPHRALGNLELWKRIR